MFTKNIFCLFTSTLISYSYAASFLSLKDEFFEKPISHTTLMESSAEFGHATFNVLEALADPQFMGTFGKTLEPVKAIQLSTLLNQASSNFLTYAFQNIPQPSESKFVIYKFTITPSKNLPEFASLFEDLLDNDELITPTIEDFYYDIKGHDYSKLPFERFIALCTTDMKLISEGRRAAINDFLRRTLQGLKNFSREIALELMGTGSWDDETVLDFQKFINTRIELIKPLIGIQ